MRTPYGKLVDCMLDGLSDKAQALLAGELMVADFNDHDALYDSRALAEHGNAIRCNADNKIPVAWDKEVDGIEMDLPEYVLELEAE